MSLPSVLQEFCKGSEFCRQFAEGDIVLMLIVGLLWPASVISTCFKLRYREA